MRCLDTHRGVGAYPVWEETGGAMTSQGVNVLRHTAFILIILLLAGCSTAALPDDARQALEDYWNALPSEPSLERAIVRSWEGEPTDLGPGEVWCVEAEVASDDPELDGTTAKWIVMRSDGNAEWSAILLAAMSSLWPYEACGVSPGE